MYLCIICKQRYPCTTLQCNHNFCYVCISQWHAKGRNDCPYCRQDFDLNNVTVDALTGLEVCSSEDVENMNNLLECFKNCLDLFSDEIFQKFERFLNVQEFNIVLFQELLDKKRQQ